MGRCETIVKKLIIEDGLLLTNIKLIFKRGSLLLKRVLVDTGSGSKIVSTDLAESIGIIAEENDMIYRISGVGVSEFVFSKTVDTIKIGDMQAENFSLEIGAKNYGFELNATINIDKLTLGSDD